MAARYQYKYKVMSELATSCCDTMSMCAAFYYLGKFTKFWQTYYVDFLKTIKNLQYNKSAHDMFSRRQYYSSLYDFKKIYNIFYK